VDERRIEFRGRRVLPDWPEQIRQAQSTTTVDVKGVAIARVKYGDEEDDWGANERPCHDCVAVKGEYHVPGCDVERCGNCNGQLWFGCECEDS